MDTKTVRKYWREVITRAWSVAWEKTEMRAASLVFLAIITIIALTGLVFTILGISGIPFIVNSWSAIKSGVTLFFGSFFIFMIFFLAMLWRTPAEIDSEKENQINELKPENAKIEMFFSKPSCYTNGKIAKLRVINNSSFDIIKCHAKLDFINFPIANGEWSRKSKNSYIKDLFWGSRAIAQDGTINISGIGGEESLDLIKIHDDYFSFLFYNNGLQQDGFDSDEKGLTVGTYLIGITLYGNVGENPKKTIVPVERMYALTFMLQSDQKTTDRQINSELFPYLQIAKAEIKKQ